MTFEELCKQIINEADENNNQPAENSNNDNTETQATNTENNVDAEEIKTSEETEKLSEEENELNLSEVEAEFLQKFIEYTELKYLATIYKDIVADFKEVLGKDIKTNALQFMSEHKEEQTAKLNTLKKELTDLRNTIKNEEEEKTKEANRKLNLISILDKKVVAEAIDSNTHISSNRTVRPLLKSDYKSVNTTPTVRVTCYDETEEYKSAEEAIAHFKEGMSYCDPGSSEFARYASIVAQLEAGKTEVSDEY